MNNNREMFPNALKLYRKYPISMFLLTKHHQQEVRVQITYVKILLPSNVQQKFCLDFENTKTSESPNVVPRQED